MHSVDSNIKSTMRISCQFIIPTAVYKLSKLFRFYHFTSDLNADSPMMQFFSYLIKIVRISEKIRNNKLAKRKWMILMNKRYVLLMRLPLL